MDLMKVKTWLGTWSYFRC